MGLKAGPRSTDFYKFGAKEPKHLQSADHICKALQKKRWSKRLQSAAKRLTSSTKISKPIPHITIRGHKSSNLPGGGNGNGASGSDNASDNILESCAIPSQPATTNISPSNISEQQNQQNQIHKISSLQPIHTSKTAKSVHYSQFIQAKSEQLHQNSQFITAKQQYQFTKSDFRISS
ncbi:hypothetical protein LXL04_037892 [Taraxacum kok-saghyz]